MAIFSTPSNELSFSALIDAALLKTGRVTKLREAVGYANSTIRECQAIGLFKKDLIEETEVATANPHFYTPSALHRTIGTAKYTTQERYPNLRQPGRQQKDQTYYFYGADDYFVFAGPMVGETIALSNYYVAKRFVYYKRLGETIPAAYGEYTVRKAYYDTEVPGWLYLNVGETAYVASIGDEDEELLRRQNAIMWLIQEWWDLILEGTVSKLFNSVGDTRGSVSYSSYKAMQGDLRIMASQPTENF